MTDEMKIIRRQSLTGFQLKLIALVTMVVDHVGAVLLPQFGFLRAIGRTAFPLYAFLAAEGCRRTGDRNRYLLRLGLFALISEIPFDLAFGAFFIGERLPRINLMDHTNIFFTLFFGVACVHILDTLCRQPRRVRLLGGALGGVGILLGILVLALTSGARAPCLAFLYGYTLCALFACARLPAPPEEGAAAKGLSAALAAVPCILIVFLAEASRCDYSAFGVLLIVLLFTAGTPKRAAAYLAVGMLLYYGPLYSLGYGFQPWYLVFALAAAALALAYNGRRGRDVKWAFYWAYPAHIAAIAALRVIFLLPA